MLTHTKTALSFFAALMALATLPAQAQMDPDEYTNGAIGVMGPQFRMQAIAQVAKLNDPSFSFNTDTAGSNATALKAALSANIGALGEKCDTGRVPAADCTTYLNEMDGFLADNKVSSSEVKPWLDQVDVLAK